MMDVTKHTLSTMAQVNDARLERRGSPWMQPSTLSGYLYPSWAALHEYTLSVEICL